jgi:hypothetical protein
MDAERVLKQMAAVYADCRSYRDSGCVRSRFLGNPGLPAFETDKPFRTHFVRPNRFRFEFSRTDPGQTEAGRCVLWTAGGTVSTWSALGGELNRAQREQWERFAAERLGGTLQERRGELGIFTEYESLSRGIAAFSGVSGGASHTVPALLMPDVVCGQRLTGLVQVACLDDGDLDGAACYLLRGQPPAPVGPQAEASRRVFREMTGMEPPTEFEPVELWIDRRSMLLRRVETRHRLPMGESVQVTTYEAELDVSIPEEELAFDGSSG